MEEFLEYEDKALTGKLFSINPYPTCWWAGEFHPKLIPNHPPVIRPWEEKTEGACHLVTPGHLTDPISNPCLLSRAGADFSPGHSRGAKQMVRQPVGECDSESELPCSFPRRNLVDPPEVLPNPATESNRRASEEYIKEHNRSSAFNTFKRQHWPVTSGAPTRIHPPAVAVRTYCRSATKVPLHFMDEVRAEL